MDAGLTDVTNRVPRPGNKPLNVPYRDRTANFEGTAPRDEPAFSHRLRAERISCFCLLLGDLCAAIYARSITIRTFATRGGSAGRLVLPTG